MREWGRLRKASRARELDQEVAVNNRGKEMAR